MTDSDFRVHVNGLALFSQHQHGRHLHHGILLALQVLFEGLHLSLVLDRELLELLLLFEGEHWPIIGMLRGPR